MASIYDNMSRDEIVAYRRQLTEQRSAEIARARKEYMAALDQERNLRNQATEAYRAAVDQARNQRTQARDAAKAARDQARQAARDARDAARREQEQRFSSSLESLKARRDELGTEEYNRQREALYQQRAADREAINQTYKSAFDSASSAYEEATRSATQLYDQLRTEATQARDGARSTYEQNRNAARAAYQAARDRTIESFAIKRADASLGLRYVREMQRNKRAAERAGQAFQPMTYQQYLGNLMGDEKRAFEAQEAQRKQEAEARGETYTPQQFNSEYAKIKRLYEDMGSGIGGLPQNLAQMGPQDMPAQQAIQQQQAPVPQEQQAPIQQAVEQQPQEQPQQQQPLLFETVKAQEVSPLFAQQQEQYNPYLSMFQPQQQMPQQQIPQQTVQSVLLPQIGFTGQPSQQQTQQFFNPMQQPQYDPFGMYGQPQYNPYLTGMDQTMQQPMQQPLIQQPSSTWQQMQQPGAQVPEQQPFGAPQQYNPYLI